MSFNTLGKLHHMCPKASDGQLKKGLLCVFIDLNGTTYSITPRQLKLMLAFEGE